MAYNLTTLCVIPTFIECLNDTMTILRIECFQSSSGNLPSVRALLIYKW